MKAFNQNYLYHYAAQAVSQRLIWPVLANKQLTISLRRDDLLSEQCSGNKFYKLFFNLQKASSAGCKTLVSFGGAYSNHIYALAAAGKQYQFNTVGIIRGHRPEILSPTLQDAQDFGMRLFFINKHDYQQKNMTALEPTLKKDYGDYWLIPEGGDNPEGIKGCEVLGNVISASLQPYKTQARTVCCAIGTGTTLTGILAGLDEDINALGFSVLKGKDTLTEKIQKSLSDLNKAHTNWKIISDYHHGGYAKTTPELLQFMQDFEQNNQLQIEPVYMAKMLWGIEQLALQDYWAQGEHIEIIHGGGLQGRRGFQLYYQ